MPSSPWAASPLAAPPHPRCGAHERLREIDEVATSPSIRPPWRRSDTSGLQGPVLRRSGRRSALAPSPPASPAERPDCGRPAPVEAHASRRPDPARPSPPRRARRRSARAASRTTRPVRRPAPGGDSAWTSCGVAITTTLTSGSLITASAPETAFSKPCRSAARRAETPLAVVTATKRSKPASRKAGSSVPVEKAPAPIQPTPGWARSAGTRPQAHSAGPGPAEAG